MRERLKKRAGSRGQSMSVTTDGVLAIDGNGISFFVCSVGFLICKCLL